MKAPWIVLAAIAAVAVVYVLLPVIVSTFVRFRAKRRLECPETGASAEVGVDARWAALTSAFRHPLLRVRSCSLWPKREGCGESCLSAEEEKAEPLRRPGF
ncbi:MAG: hypothetical protein HY724_06260 [Candidatus Rokubacteria bacterium]|nr:hypothetical protein [Candidatus Rokubacteria bacterium]